VTGWRTRAALLRLARALRRHEMPRRRRREIIAEIAANLHVATADFGEREALRRLGSIDALAGAYAEGQPATGLRAAAGLRAALGVLLALVALSLLRVPTFGAIDVFDRHTGTTTWIWEVSHLWRFGGDTATGTLFEGTVYSAALVLLPALAFAIWSRPWRLMHDHHGAAAPHE
jgi:hypothetical protein